MVRDLDSPQNAPMTPALAVSKLFLLADDRRQPDHSPAVVRRYRLARLDVNGGQAVSDDRFGHLKRVYD